MKSICTISPSRYGKEYEHSCDRRGWPPFALIRIFTQHPTDHHLYPPLSIASRYLKYFITASNGKGHGIHSPFVFDFVTKVLNAREKPASFGRIEALRASLKRDVRVIPVEDMGAGSGLDNNTLRRVRDIAGNAAKPPKFGRLLHRIAAHYRCRSVIELGTSLGISTAYMATADSVEKVVTLEGAAQVHALAMEHFKTLGLDNVTTVPGNFDDTLEKALQLVPSPDLVFFDGNHRYAPTLRYFLQCMEHAGEDAVFIFDDIHWSREMEDAWSEIILSPRVTCSIDLFFVGIVFFRKGFRERQHFTIRY